MKVRLALSTSLSNYFPKHDLENSDRLERILMMLYVVQNYWAYFGLYPSSGM
jgi:hypothetical protein